MRLSSIISGIRLLPLGLLLAAATGCGGTSVETSTPEAAAASGGHAPPPSDPPQPPGTPPAIQVVRWQPPAELAEAYERLDALPAPRSVSIAGQWKGYFFRYPNAIGLTVQLEEAGADSLTGKVERFAISDRARLGPGAVRPGEFAVSGGFSPRTGTFALQPQLDRRRGDPQAFPFMGVYIPAAGEHPETLVGPWGQNRYGYDFVVLTRPDAAEKLLHEPIRKALSFQPKGPAPSAPLDGLRVYKKLGPFDRKGKDNPFYKSFFAWAGRLKEEYPDMPRDAGVIGRRSLNLFEDEYFARHFGTDYLDITPEEAGWLSSPMTLDRSPDRIWGDRLRDYSALGRPFTSMPGEGGRLWTVAHLLPLRQLRRYREQLAKGLTTMSPAPDALSRLDELEKVALEALKPLWPSEQKQTQASFEAARRRLAAPSLQLAAAQAIRTARGREGALELVMWEGTHAGALALTGPDERARLLGWVNGRLDSLAAELAAAELGQLESLGDDLDGLLAGDRWSRGLRQKYGLVLRTQPFAALFQHFRARRSALLDKVKPDLLRKLDEQTSVAAVDKFLEEYLGVNGDRGSTAGKALARAAMDRKAALDRARWLARFSPQEQKWLKGQVIIPDPSYKDPPTEEEIRLALLREIAFLGGEMVDASRARYTIPPLGRFGLYILVTIQGVRLEPGGCQPHPEGGYVCRYRLSTDFRYSENFRSWMGDHPLGPELLEGILRLSANAPNNVLTDRFVLTPGVSSLVPGGWRSPTAQERKLTGMFGGTR